jgi:hypothetical protein
MVRALIITMGSDSAEALTRFHEDRPPESAAQSDRR